MEPGQPAHPLQASSRLTIATGLLLPFDNAPSPSDQVAHLLRLIRKAKPLVFRQSLITLFENRSERPKQILQGRAAVNTERQC
jgi:hypothetical protein